MEIILAFILISVLSIGLFLAASVALEILLRPHKKRIFADWLKKQRCKIHSVLQKRWQKLRFLVRYHRNNKLLRGHDFLASLWLDQVQGKKPSTALIAQLVAGATQVEKEDGRKFDGRPIRQGWMSRNDFDAYFAFVDEYGPLDVRYRALIQQASYFKLKRCPAMAGFTSLNGLHHPSESSALRDLVYELSID